LNKNAALLPNADATAKRSPTSKTQT
jgi:hypothetical protein